MSWIKNKKISIKRVKRVIGILLYDCLGKHLPVSYKKMGGGFAKKYRKFCARLILDKCGNDINIEKGAVFSQRIEIGDNSGIGVRATLNGKVVIGNNVMMGPDCTVHTRNHDFSRIDIPIIQQGYTSEKPVYIEDDVWIGSNVIILPGVTIGTGSVIGAGCIVTKNVPPYAIYAGNPGKVIRYRKES